MEIEGFWRDRAVFVTGATGLLGSWVTGALADRGAQVTCLVRDWVPQSRLLLFLDRAQHSATAAFSGGGPAAASCALANAWNRVNLVRGELEDLELLIRVLNEYEIDTVFHLGAQTIVGAAARSALSTFESNIRGTWNLLEASRACSRLVKRIVVASSDKAYGAHEELPYTEDMALQGRFPYDVSKSCADLLALSYFHTYRLPVAITRCGNLFGGGDLNFNRLVPGTIRSALRGEAPVIRSDGTLVRDYFYVRDAVEAYLQLAERLPELAGEAFNFGNEIPTSVSDLVRHILSLMGKSSLEPLILNEANHEIPRQYLDCSKARRLLDWEPRFGLDDGLRETIGWYAGAQLETAARSGG